MSTKHTPGPWKVIWEGNNPEWTIVTNEYGAVIANVNGESGPDTTSAPAYRKMPSEANAGLIASAPELLMLVRAYKQDLEGAGMSDGPAYRACCEAIEKAGGEL